MTRTFPELNVDDFESPVDYIRAFYQELGWNPETQELEPRKIKIHFDTWGEICMALKEKWGVMAALTWMNLGPSGDASNPFSLTEKQVKIVAGAMKEISNE